MPYVYDIFVFLKVFDEKIHKLDVIFVFEGNVVGGNLFNFRGDEGIALTRLALIGNAEFNGRIIEVRSSGDFIEQKSKIRVERILDGVVLVEKV